MSDPKPEETAPAPEPATNAAEESETAADKVKGAFSALSGVLGSAAERVKEVGAAGVEKASSISAPEGLKDGANNFVHRVKDGASSAADAAKRGTTAVRDEIKARVKGHAVFGMELHAVLKRDGGSRTVPRVVEKCTQHLEEKASGARLLFQLAASEAQVESYKKAFDTDDEAADLSGCMEPHTVAALLRFYFVELPDPLIPTELYRPLLDSDTSDSPDTTMADLLTTMPREHLNVLRHMLVFLNKLSGEAGMHGANCRVCAVAFGPAWLRAKNVGVLTIDLPNIVKVTDRMIQRQEDIFKIVDEKLAAAAAAKAAAAAATIPAPEAAPTSA